MNYVVEILNYSRFNFRLSHWLTYRETDLRSNADKIHGASFIISGLNRRISLDESFQGGLVSGIGIDGRINSKRTNIFSRKNFLKRLIKLRNDNYSKKFFKAKVYPSRTMNFGDSRASFNPTFW
jgi:hypothetical protein